MYYRPQSAKSSSGATDAQKPGLPGSSAASDASLVSFELGNNSDRQSYQMPSKVSSVVCEDRESLSVQSSASSSDFAVVSCSGVSNSGLESKPPSCDTGAQNTQGGQVSAFIDYFACTFPDHYSLEQVQSLYGSEGWVVMPSGRFGYKGHLRRGHISILFDGGSDMGIHVDMTGQGCRELEGQEWFQDWPSFIGWLLEYEDVQVTRLDLAADDHGSLLHIPVIRQAIKDGRCVARWRKGRSMEELALSNGGTDGETIYLGSRSSDTMLRMYNKGKQQGGSESFVRVELETKRDKAQQLARLIATGDMSIFANILRGLVDFKAEGHTDKNRSRWQTVEWWQAFLGEVDKVRLTVEKAVQTISEVVAWLERQVAPSLAVFLQYFGGDIDSLISICNKGRKRWKPKHRLLAGSS